jgi:hypothetical protein
MQHRQVCRVASFRHVHTALDRNKACTRGIVTASRSRHYGCLTDLIEIAIYFHRLLEDSPSGLPSIFAPIRETVDLVH